MEYAAVFQLRPGRVQRKFQVRQRRSTTVPNGNGMVRMKRSEDRILATHVGSLPRPADLSEVMRRVESGGKANAAEDDELIARAVQDVVAKQASLGIDVVSDGEMSKPGFVNYVNDRLSGFEPAKAGAIPE
jgi:hypothetical protein